MKTLYAPKNERKKKKIFLLCSVQENILHKYTYICTFQMKPNITCMKKVNTNIMQGLQRQHSDTFFVIPNKHFYHCFDYESQLTYTYIHNII